MGSSMEVLAFELRFCFSSGHDQGGTYRGYGQYRTIKGDLPQWLREGGHFRVKDKGYRCEPREVVIGGVLVLHQG